MRYESLAQILLRSIKSIKYLHGMSPLTKMGTHGT